MHSTSNLEDDYIGSGKRLWYSIQAHGREKHSKEILEFCENRKVLKQREIEIVTAEFIADPMCMNLTEGGFGGGKAASLGGKAFHRKMSEDENFSNKIKKRQSDAAKKLWENGKSPL